LQKVLRIGKEEACLKWMASPPVLLSELSRQASATSRVLQDNDNTDSPWQKWIGVPTGTELLCQVKPCGAGLIPAEKKTCLDICVYFYVYIILLCYFSREINFL